MSCGRGGMALHVASVLHSAVLRCATGTLSRGSSPPGLPQRSRHLFPDPGIACAGHVAQRRTGPVSGLRGPCPQRESLLECVADVLGRTQDHVTHVDGGFRSGVIQGILCVAVSTAVDLYAGRTGKPTLGRRTCRTESGQRRVMRLRLPGFDDDGEAGDAEGSPGVGGMSAS